MRTMTELNQTETTLNQDDEKSDLKNRRIRSFVLRQGRVTKGQANALETGLPRFGITYEVKPLDLNQAFSRNDSPKILEIGFGMGETTAKIAQTLPHCDFLA